MHGVAVDPQAAFLFGDNGSTTLECPYDPNAPVPEPQTLEHINKPYDYNDVVFLADKEKPKSVPGEVGRHGDLRAPENYQSNHLNQDAVFKPDPKLQEPKDTDKRIGTNDGAAIILKGGVPDKNSQHFKFHKSLDDWWQDYRDKKVRPTIDQYNTALEKALTDSGLAEAKVKEAMEAAKKNQTDHKFVGTDLVPRLPGARNTPKD